MRREAGFSLIEVLAAVAVFALVSAIPVGMLGAALRGLEQAERALDRLGSAQRIAALLKSDVGQAVPRSARRIDGVEDPRLFAGAARGVDAMPGLSDAREILVLTRTGWTNPGGAQPRSGLQRVAWLYDGERLWRETAAYPDAAPGAEPVRQLVAEGVRDVELGFLSGSVWLDEAAVSTRGQGAPRLPDAVRIRYALDGIGTMEHVVLGAVTGSAL